MEILLPHATALALMAGRWSAITPDGEMLDGPQTDIAALPVEAPLLVCHWPYLSSRLPPVPLPALDILELFAFVRPATFCVPTVGGLAAQLGHPVPQTADDAAQILPALARELLLELTHIKGEERSKLVGIAGVMGHRGQGWGWTQCVLATLGATFDPDAAPRPREALNVMHDLPEWTEAPPPPPAAARPLEGEETRAHLRDLVTRRRGAGRAGETRAAQENYTTRILEAFAPRTQEGQPNVVTAEAGTGVGKTLGYLAPAHLWAEKNEGTVWISTYTRNLQRQIDAELETLYPDAAERARKTVIRKGRENYLCLLNFSDLAGATITARDPRTAVAAGLMARWIMATPDGDLSGNAFPGWLAGLLGATRSTGLADRRGECVYAACDHYKKCFIEKTQRRARQARLVIGNHALAMSALALPDSAETLPERFIFDEGHHLFDAADGSFAAHLTGAEGAELRRWIIGPEDGSGPRRSRRARGLKKRLEGLLAENDPALQKLDEALHAARALPGPDWRKRMGAGEPAGPVESLLYAIWHQVRARAKDPESGWSIECDPHPLAPDVAAEAPRAMEALRAIHRPLAALSKALRHRLETEFETLNPDTRARLDAMGRSLERRATMTVAAWVAMLQNLWEDPPQAYVDWFELTRIDGRDYDVGFFRHHRDPATPFGAALRPYAHGVLITSATLKTSRTEDEEAWQEADRMTGAAAISPLAPARVTIPSPFDYKARTRVLVIRDIPKNDTALLAKACEALFTASRGGALGLFTAIHRLRAVHARLASKLEEKGIPVYAQHVDAVDTGTLVDIFRAEEDACLLGTDAVRDGVDVPGRSLRLIAFDRVPWPRPTILHRERRKTLGGRAYEESLTRLKLRQAYGRLIRTPEDRGVFVMLDSAFPGRLEDAFPEGVAVERVSLDEALAATRNFFDPETA